ncbi:MAG: ABC transporter ATP-binding protein [Gammaproteobacteria bacterium]|nr:ABC transporter ATP-binding protein [Gammaproteobacteria bacterium]MCY4218715.1 ABC transporter ATP-binding protein [Gammaproteobacteria bacterium]
MVDILTIKNLQVEFDYHNSRIPAVKDISLTIPQGRTVALVGESGSGKSVTAQAIMQILPKKAQITQGSIRFNDPESGNSTEIVSLDPMSKQIRSIRGGRISMIFQEPMVSLSPVHTVGNQISEAVLLHRDVNKSEALKLSEDMLDRVGFPDPKRAIDTYPFELSGGLRQRAMIACALVCRPAILIADEPTTALDVTIQAQILKLISDMQSELNMAVLLITHDLGVVANVANEVVVMYHGQIMESGIIEDIFRNPSHPYLKALIKAIPHFDMKPDERLTPVRNIESSVGELLRMEPAKELPANRVHLEVRDISKSFRIKNNPIFKKVEVPEIKAVSGIGFEVHRGECFGLVGESGCGKTTLSKILMKALSPDEGNVIYYDKTSKKGIDILALEGDDLFQFRRKMQFIFQDPFSSLNPRMTVFDIIREPLLIHEIGDIDYQREFVKELVRVVGLDPRFLNRYPHSFSGGQRQRLGIARALALKPDFVICDEPVSALDVSIQAQILNLLKDLRTELGLTTIFITHNLAVVKYIADRVGVMCRGRLVEIADRDSLFENPVHPYTKALLGAVPHPDLAKPLDFDSTLESQASEPKSWSAPFRSQESVSLQLQEIKQGHSVLMEV